MQQNGNVLEMSAVHWRCFIEAVPVLQVVLVIMKKDATFMVNDLHIVAQIYAGTYLFDERVKLYEFNQQIYLSEDHINALIEKDIFSDVVTLN